MEFDLQPRTLPYDFGLTLRSELRLPLRRFSRVGLGLKAVLDQSTRTLTAGVDGALDEYKVRV